MIKDLVAPNDPVLLKIAAEIALSEIHSVEIKGAIERILDSSLGRQRDKNKPMAVGLAAPQIGISKRIIAVDLLANGKGSVGDLQVFINPKIVWQSEELEEWYEGCWSTDRVCGIVSRPKEIKVEAFTVDGEKIISDYSGYTARIFQHEIDHLNGKEFVTHISDDNNLHWVEEDEFQNYRNGEAWRYWQKKCPREKWNKIKGIL